LKTAVTKKRKKYMLQKGKKSLMRFTPAARTAKISLLSAARENISTVDDSSPMGTVKGKKDNNTVMDNLISSKSSTFLTISRCDNEKSLSKKSKKVNKETLIIKAGRNCLR
jgi:hypothetical protein